MAKLRCLLAPSRPVLGTTLRQTHTPASSPSRRLIATLTDRVQIYRSPSHDPFINLSIEHHLLRHSAPESTVLFLYANAPCVVIGRNQNPWLEVDLARLRRGLHAPGDVALVRRRSGGGTVFHDAGNVNWSVICPPAVFDRDRHAEMVVRALGALGVRGARVNERHDIVQDVPSTDTHPATFKVSGSAYKLTRLRSLHHGTCLLSSPHLSRVGALLRSPAEPYIKARGVESVRSPIRNVGVDVAAFEDAVIREFTAMYGGVDAKAAESALAEMAEHAEVAEGVAELRSPDWIFNQTPQFTFSTEVTEEDQRPRPPRPEDISPDFHATFTIRHGKITGSEVRGLDYHEDSDNASQDHALSQALIGLSTPQIADWRETLRLASPVPVDTGSPGMWLNQLFGHDSV